MNHYHLTKWLQKRHNTYRSKPSFRLSEICNLIDEIGTSLLQNGSPMLQQENRHFGQSLMTHQRDCIMLGTCWLTWIPQASGGIKPNIRFMTYLQPGSARLRRTFCQLSCCFLKPQRPRILKASKKPQGNGEKLEGSKLPSKPNLKELEHIAIQSRIGQTWRYGHGWATWIWYNLTSVFSAD